MRRTSLTTAADQLFINHDLGAFVALDDREERVLWSGEGEVIPDARFDRAHRLLSLPRWTGIEVTVLDEVLRLLCENRLDASALRRLAVLVDLPVLELLRLIDVLEKDQSLKLLSAFDLFRHEDPAPADLHEVLEQGPTDARFWLVQNIVAVGAWARAAGLTPEDLEAATMIVSAHFISPVTFSQIRSRRLSRFDPPPPVLPERPPIPRSSWAILTSAVGQKRK